MKLYDRLKKHPEKIVLGIIVIWVMFGTWVGKFFAYMLITIIMPNLPSVFLFGDKVDITFNLPENIQLKKVSATYSNSNCKSYSIGTDNWITENKKVAFKTKEIAKNQYRTTVHFQDNFICQRQLESIYWQLEYQDIEKVYPQVAKKNGGRGAEFKGNGLSLYHWDKKIWKTRNGTENLFSRSHFSPKIQEPYEVEYWMTPIQGELLYFSHKPTEFNGEFGLKTRNIFFTATVEEPPFDSIERIK